MPVTTNPAEEACQAIVDRINSGSGLTYTLPQAATYGFRRNEDVSEQGVLIVEVLHQGSETLEETLDVEDRTSHSLLVSVRKRVPDLENTTINPLLLIVRQIFQRVNGYATSRIRVWDCDLASDNESDPIVRQVGVFSASFPLRVEVEASP